MAMEIDFDGFHELDFSYYSTTTTNTPSMSIETEPVGWTDNIWSPVVNWDELASHHEDFHDLIQSIVMAKNDQTSNSKPPELDDTICISDSTMSDNVIALDNDEIETTGGQERGDDFIGLRLIHLLMAAAEFLSDNKSHDLARVILLRLKELVSSNNGTTTIERLVAHFTDALSSLLDGGAATNHGQNHHGCDDHDVITAFQLLQDMSPYVKFGHFTANQAILESMTSHDRRIHIVDFDIMEGIQWSSLMQALVSKRDNENIPIPHLRITAVTRGGGNGGGRRSLGTVQETGRRLAAFAASIGQPFSFSQCKLDSNEGFKTNSLKLVKGEALIVNCMLNLPHCNYRSPESVSSFLLAAKSLNPRLITLVQEETGNQIETGFVDRFIEILHHYSAIYDSLEAGFPMKSRARGLMERVFLGPRINGSLGRIYTPQGDCEIGLWDQWLGSIEFKPVNVSFANHCQAKLLLGLYNDGYRVEEGGCNKLVLGWKNRALISASVWTSPNLDNDL